MAYSGTCQDYPPCPAANVVMVPFLPHPLHHPLITMGDEGSTGEGGRAGGGEGPPEDMELLLV